MVQKIKKIYVMSLAYTLGLLYLIFGIIMGVLLSLIKTNPELAARVNPTLLELAYWKILLVYPVGYAFGGFVTGILIAFLYNLVSKKTGGIKIELQEASTSKKKK